MTRAICVLDGPSLDPLGRGPDTYGKAPLAEVDTMCRTAAGAQPIEVRHTDTAHERVDWIHEAIDGGPAIVSDPIQAKSL